MRRRLQLVKRAAQCQPELWGLINLKFGQCSEAAIVADHSSPQIPGTSITFTGSALCAGTAQYEFQVQPPGGGWTYLHGYGTSATATWDTTGKPYGTYQFEVDARNLGSSVSYDTYADMSMRLARCVTPVITPDHPSPQLPGTAITFTASVTCNGTPEYQFSMQPPGGAWSVVQPYGSAAVFRWITTQLAYGNYNFSVSVRVAGTTVSAESTQTLTYSLTSCNATALSTSKTAPQPTGTQVTLTGSATCVGAPQYRFMIQPPGGKFSIVQDFGTNAAFTWNGAGPGGTYGLEVDAKGAGAATSAMDSAQSSFALTSCAAVTLTSSLNTPQVPGASVVLTGSATCPGTAQYRFAIQKPNGAYTIVQDYGSANTYAWNTTDRASPQGAGTVITFSANTTTCPSPLFRFLVQTPAPDLAWTVMQDYSTSKTFRWQPSGPGGQYRIEIDARDSTRPVQWDQYAVVPFTINVCTGAALSVSVASPQPAGTQVVLTGSAGASFCPNPVYEFWVLAPGSSTWTIAQAYSTSAAYNWNTNSLAVGTYRFSVQLPGFRRGGPGRDRARLQVGVARGGAGLGARTRPGRRRGPGPARLSARNGGVPAHRALHPGGAGRRDPGGTVDLPRTRAVEIPGPHSDLRARLRAPGAARLPTPSRRGEARPHPGAGGGAGPGRRGRLPRAGDDSLQYRPAPGLDLHGHVPRVLSKLSYQRRPHRAEARVHLRSLRGAGRHIPPVGNRGAVERAGCERGAQGSHAVFRLVREPRADPPHGRGEFHSQRDPRIRGVRRDTDLPVRRQLPPDR